VTQGLNAAIDRGTIGSDVIVGVARCSSIRVIHQGSEPSLNRHALAFWDAMPKARARKHYKVAMQADGTYTIIAHQGIDEPSIELPGFATLDAALDEIARLEAIDRRDCILGPIH
jgi:hypothetical protein